ncbi:hypothetical protein [Streptomyces sp. LMG1-1-1.1]
MPGAQISTRPPENSPRIWTSTASTAEPFTEPVLLGLAVLVVRNHFKR